MCNLSLLLNEEPVPNRLVNLICENQEYLFQRQIPGTPYWRKLMHEEIAMLKHLGIPT